MRHKKVNSDFDEASISLESIRGTMGNDLSEKDRYDMYTLNYHIKGVSMRGEAST